MLNPRITECQNCQNLPELLLQVDCSLQNFLRNRINNETYNVESYYCQDTVNKLGHYKRILNKIRFNKNYISCIPLDKIVFQVKKLLFGDCIPCEDCEQPEETTTTSTTVTATSTITSITTSTSTTTNTTTTSTTTTIFIDPPGAPVACGDEVPFDGGVTFPSAFEITLGSGTGTVELVVNAFNIPDRFIVLFDDEIVIDTGYRGDTSYQTALDSALIDLGYPTETITAPGNDTFTFNKTTSTTSAFVYVFAPLPDTLWTFTLECAV